MPLNQQQFEARRRSAFSVHCAQTRKSPRSPHKRSGVFVCASGESAWQSLSPRTGSTNGVVLAGCSIGSGREWARSPKSSRVENSQSRRRFAEARLGAIACLGVAVKSERILLDCPTRTASLASRRMWGMFRCDKSRATSRLDDLGGHPDLLPQPQTANPGLFR